jgi:hypothetical protein
MKINSERHFERFMDGFAIVFILSMIILFLIIIISEPIIGIGLIFIIILCYIIGYIHPIF